MENAAPMAPPMAMSGNMLSLPCAMSREAQHQACQVMLLEGRERRRHHQHILLLQERPRCRARRPHAFADRLGPDALALAGVLVGPDVHPPVERAEFRMPCTDQRRQL